MLSVTASCVMATPVLQKLWDVRELLGMIKIVLFNRVCSDKTLCLESLKEDIYSFEVACCMDNVVIALRYVIGVMMSSEIPCELYGVL